MKVNIHGRQLFLILFIMLMSNTLLRVPQAHSTLDNYISTTNTASQTKQVFNYFKETRLNLTDNDSFKLYNLWGNDLQIGFFYQNRTARSPESDYALTSGLGMFVLFKKPIGIIELTNEKGYVIKRAVIYAVWGSLTQYHGIVEFKDINNNHLLEHPIVYPKLSQNHKESRNATDVIVKAVPFIRENVTLSIESNNNSTVIIRLSMVNASYYRHQNEDLVRVEDAKVEQMTFESIISFSILEKSTTEVIRTLNVVLDDATSNATETIRARPNSPRNRIIEVNKKFQTVSASKVLLNLNQTMTIDGWDTDNASTSHETAAIALIQDVSFFNYLELDNKPFLPHETELNLRPLKLNFEINHAERNITDFRRVDVPPDAIYNLTRPYITIFSPWNTQYQHRWETRYHLREDSLENSKEFPIKQQASRVHPVTKIPRYLTGVLNETWYQQQLQRDFRILALEFRQATLYENLPSDSPNIVLTHHLTQVNLEYTIPQVNEIIIIPPPVADLTNVSSLMLFIVPVIGLIAVVVNRFTKK